MHAASLTVYGIAIADEHEWFFSVPLAPNGALIYQQASVVRLPIKRGHYFAQSLSLQSLRRRYFVLDVRQGVTPPEFAGWGDPLVQRLIVDTVQQRVLTPPLRPPRYIDPVAWSPSERYLVYRVAREVDGEEIGLESKHAERYEVIYRLLDLETNRAVPLPNEIAHATAVGFLADSHDTLWALTFPQGVRVERNGLYPSFWLLPDLAPKPLASPVARWVYQIPRRRLTQMSEAQYQSLQERWEYMRWQLGGEAIVHLAAIQFYREVLAPLSAQLPISRTSTSPFGNADATVLQVNEHTALLEVSQSPNQEDRPSN